MLYSSETPLKKEAFAKINLGLWVLGKREDGYHEIVTFIHEITLKDELLLWESDDISVFVKGADIEGENIVTKAIRELKRETNIVKGIRVDLIKRIPIKAGLGGGSSDAAAAIKGALDLWNMRLSEEELLRLASYIGSDVPFFIKGGFCLSFGKGEKVKKIDFSLSKALDIVLVIPKFGLETKNVYSWLNPPYSEPPNVMELIEAFRKMDWETLRRNLKNDLEKPVFERCPELKSVKEKLLNCGALFSMMSGSGSAIFGIFKKPFNSFELIKKTIGDDFKIILTGFKGEEN